MGTGKENFIGVGVEGSVGTEKEQGNEFDPYGVRADSVPVDDAADFRGVSP